MNTTMGTSPLTGGLPTGMPAGMPMGCPPPFLDAANFSSSGGYIKGRMCAPPDLMMGIQCCLPCPATDFLYPKSFKAYYRASEALNGLGFILLLFLFITFLVLPPEKTRRHYLSICLVIAILVEALGFAIPLLAQPPKCYDKITPNDMYSNMTCAWTGAMLIAGGLAIVVWIFVRALSMHLQICWDIVPGQRFFYYAQGFGWAIVSIFFTLTIVLTGVSFRFGDACHVNSKDSIKVFWTPLLAIAGLTAVAQLATFCYCINVYVRNIWNDDVSETRTTTTLPSFTTSINAHSARVVYRRVRKVIWLQWRSMLLVVFILIDLIYFAVVFLYTDNVVSDMIHNGKVDKILPFMMCLFKAGGPSEECYALGQKVFVNMRTMASILILMGIAGFQCFALMIRRPMLTGWVELFKRLFTRKSEFVSIHAKHASASQRDYEMLKVGSQEVLGSSFMVKSPDSMTLASVTDAHMSVISGKADYLSKEYRETARPPSSSRPTSRRSHTGSLGSMEHSNWSSPSMSFAGPRTPSQVLRSDSISSRPAREWDSRSAFARTGLAMHPPTEEDERDLAGFNIEKT